MPLSVSPNVKNQHYVWRHYLEPWAVNGTFCCYRHKEKHLFGTQPKSVASETYFYQAHKLTAGDREFSEQIISPMPDERLRELNREYINLSQLCFDLRELAATVHFRDEETRTAV